jgi:hypothetical protein
LDNLDKSDEDSRAKFIRLAESRTEKAVSAIENISSLANPRSYNYDEKDTQQIIKALRESVSMVENAFKTKEKKEFKLK